MLKHVPNILTGLRLLLAPAAAWAAWQYWDESPAATHAAWAYWGAGLFAAAALTDLFDGWAARAFQAESKLGRILDPIADKLLVGLPLIVLAIQGWRGGHQLWPAIALCTAVIIGRDTLITLLRLMSPDGEGVRVSSMAKWKTAVELVVVGAAFAGPAVREWAAPVMAGSVLESASPGVWVALLALAAAMSAWTGAAYLKPVTGPRK